MVSDLVAASVPVLAVSFQGYEVTLPASWPYVEAVFQVAMRHGIDRSFITNGMLLSRWTERVRVLEPSRISVSVDGADAKTNDALRGVRGALDATVDSVTRFLTDAPDFNDRVAIASTLYLSKNLNSLKRMPALLHKLGLRRWALSAELGVREGKKRLVDDPSDVFEALSELVHLGKKQGLSVHVNDEFGRFSRRGRTSGFVSLPRRDSIVRVEPAGYVRVGEELMRAFDPARERRYDPAHDSFAEVLGCSRREAPVRCGEPT